MTEKKASNPESEQSTDEYTEFEKLARKLVKVPKRELDAERAKQEAESDEKKTD